jgi:hypothetical protein
VSPDDALFFFYGHTRPVTHFLAGTGYIVEDGGFSGVGISGKRYGEAFLWHGADPISHW